MKWNAVRAILIAAAVLLLAGIRAQEPVTADSLLSELLSAARNPTEEAVRKAERDTERVSDPVLRAVAEHWAEAYFDPDFRLYLNGKDDPADFGIPDPGKHAFVVLGFCLRNGEMEPELAGRCEAAAAAARACPEAIVICTGGVTGSNNPRRNSEAGLMADYLVRVCGIDPGRIFTDPEALTTGENALNSFRILTAHDIRTVTVVTSGYHMRWGLVLFNATAAWYREQGYDVELIGNWCYDTPPSPGYDEMNEDIAMSQLRTLLLTGQDALLPEAR